MFTLLVALVALNVAIATPVVRAESNGTVSGVVTNGTTGAPVARATVTLSRFERQSAESVDVTTETDDAGRYLFDGVDTAAGFVFATSVAYADVLYGSGMIRFDNGSTERTADIIVYETTTDSSIVSLSARGIIVVGSDAERGEVTIADVFSLVNTSNRTLVADDDGRTIRFTVPDNATAVEPLPGFDFGRASIERATVFATSPLRPGESTASLEYVIPYAATTASLALAADYPSELTRILIPAGSNDPAIVADADDVSLLDKGTIDISGRPFHVWETRALQPGAPLRLTLTGLPEAAAANRLHTLEPIVFVVAMLAIAGGLTGLIVLKRGLYRSRPVVLAPAFAASLESRRGELTAHLRKLEEQHSAGQITGLAYENRRRAILEELRGISRQYRGLGDDEV